MTLFVGLWAGFLLMGMHFFMPNIGGHGLYVPYNSIAWMFASLVIGAGLWAMTRRGEIVLSGFQRCVLVALPLMAAPLFYPAFPYRQFAIPGFLGLLGGVAFLFALYQFQASPRERRTVLYLLLAAVLVESIIAALQYRFPPYSVGGIFQQRNLMGSFLATGLAAALWLYASEPELDRPRKALIFAVLIAAPCFAVTANSRIGYLGLALALLLCLPALASAGRNRLLRAVGLAGAGLALGFVLLQVAPRVQEAIGLRPTVWAYSLRLFLERPWTGFGLGSFESVFRQRYMADKARDPSMKEIEENLDHPHNELLYWGVEGGLLPLIGFGIVIWGFFRVLRPLEWRRALAMLALVAPLVAHSQTEYPFHMSATHWLLLAYLIYFVESEAGALQVLKYRQRFLPRFIAVATPLLTIPFMATTLQAVRALTAFEEGGMRDRRGLEAVINPAPVAWRFASDAYYLRLRIGLSFNNREDIQAYVDWARGFVARTPRAAIYVQLVTALEALGRHEEAEATRREALMLYPLERGFQGAART